MCIRDSLCVSAIVRRPVLRLTLNCYDLADFLLCCCTHFHTAHPSSERIIFQEQLTAQATSGFRSCLFKQLQIDGIACSSNSGISELAVQATPRKCLRHARWAASSIPERCQGYYCARSVRDSNAWSHVACSKVA
eukprot:15434066-Alexandrium_andersonii.AAC.1